MNLCNSSYNLNARGSVSPDQVAYSRVIQREQFFAHMAVRSAVKFLPIA